jgi:hypothetical protein
MLCALIAVATAMAAPVMAAEQAAPVASSPATLDPARLAAGRELIAVVLPPEQRDRIMESVLNAMLHNMIAGMERGNGLAEELRAEPARRAVFDRFIERQRVLALDDLKLAMPGLIEAYAHAYARMFTIDEMTQIRAFAATPAGKKFILRSPELMSDPDVGAWQQVLAQKGATRQAAEIERLRKELAGAGKPAAS